MSEKIKKGFENKVLISEVRRMEAENKKLMDVEVEMIEQIKILRYNHKMKYREIAQVISKAFKRKVSISFVRARLVKGYAPKRIKDMVGK